METVKRIKAIPVAFDLLIELLTSDGDSPSLGGSHRWFRSRVLKDGIPPDARLVYSYTDSARRCGVLVFEHPSFDPVEPNCEPPMLHPTMQREQIFRPFPGLQIDISDPRRVVVKHDQRLVEGRFVQQQHAKLGVTDGYVEYFQKDFDLRDDIKTIRNGSPIQIMELQPK